MYRDELESAMARAQSLETELEERRERGQVDEAEISTLKQQLDQQRSEISRLRQLAGEPPYGPYSSGLAIAAFIVGLVGFLLGWFPFIGFLGLIGVILGCAAIFKANHAADQQKKGLAVAGITLGAVGTGAACIWTFVALTSSCPHVYSHDGKGYRLDADPLSGALFKGGESTDLDRLEHLAAADGRYRIRIINERDEMDHIDAVSLLAVDHARTREALPTQAGEVLLVDHAMSPRTCTDSKGRSRLDEVRGADGAAFVNQPGDFSPVTAAEPRERLTLTFPRPRARRAALILRARNTPFAAEAFARYLAEMGQGLRTLLVWAQDSKSYPYRKRLDDEMRRMGLPMEVKVRHGSRWVATEIRPIGPAVFRSQAVPIVVPPGDSPTIQVRLELTPLLWEIDQVSLARARPASPVRLRPAAAMDLSGRPLLEPLLAADGTRVSLARGEAADVAFDAPPPPASPLTRTVVMSIRGYYEFDMKGRGYMNPLAIFRHRSGRDTFPRFALRLAQRE